MYYVLVVAKQFQRCSGIYVGIYRISVLEKDWFPKQKCK